jgi:flagellar biosynthesis protein FlhB
MSHEELKQYAPTARRLEKLRRAGVTGVSPALGQLVGWLVLAGLGLLTGREIIATAGQYLARDLQDAMLAGDSVEGLAGRLGRRLMVAVGVLVVLSGAVYLLGLGAAVLQGGGRGRSPADLWESSQSVSRRQVGGADLGWGLLLGAVGVVGLVALLRGLLSSWAQANHWSELLKADSVGGVGMRVLALLAAIGLLQVLWRRGQFMAQARMTRREVLIEARETEGSWLRKTLRQAGRGKRNGRV